MPIPQLPTALPATAYSRAAFDPAIAERSTGMDLDFGAAGAPEPGDWTEFVRQYNALPDEPLPSAAYVWGAGAFGLELVRRLTEAGTRVLAVVDRNPALHAHGVAGLPCLSPEELLSRTPAAVALGIHNGSTDLATLVTRLRSSGFDVWLPQRLWRAAARVGRNWPAAFWLDGPFYGQQDPREALDEARAVLECFADEASARVFWGELCARALDKVSLRAAPEARQYAPASLPSWPQPVRLIDAGAYDGDTLRAFAQCGLSIEKSLCFEPDQANFAALQAARTSARDMMCWPLGLSDRTKLLRFHAGNGTASRTGHDGDAIIQCVSLDETAPDFPATLLKMDIEGAELDALRGAEGLIARTGCAMAISAYHTPDHLWKVPLLMHRLAPQHPMVLRAHAYGGFETVAYALPPEAADHLRTVPSAIPQAAA